MCLVVCMCVYTQLLSAWWPSPWSNEVHQHIILYALVSAFPTTLSWCPQTEKKLFVTNMISIKRCDVTEATWETSERLKSNSPNFEKSLMKHYMKLEWVGRKCPASSRTPPNKDFRIHEGSYKQFFYWWKGRRLSISTPKAFSLVSAISCHCFVLCSSMNYHQDCVLWIFSRLCICIREEIENTMFILCLY